MTLPAKYSTVVGVRGKFTEGTLQRLEEAIEAGLPKKHACKYAGINYGTLNQWLAGRVPTGMEAYLEEFVERLEAAEARGVMSLMEAIRKAGLAGDWRAAAWILEHRYPELYSQQAIEMVVSTKDGEPLRTETTVRLSPEEITPELAAKILELRQMLPEGAIEAEGTVVEGER